jgi:hypothetical protein
MRGPGAISTFSCDTPAKYPAGMAAADLEPVGFESLEDEIVGRVHLARDGFDIQPPEWILVH